MSNPNLDTASASITLAQTDFAGAAQNIANLTSQLATAQASLTADAAQIAALQAQLAAALGKNGTVLSSPLFQNLNQLTNLQKAPGWILAGGVAGNSKGN